MACILHLSFSRLLYLTGGLTWKVSTTEGLDTCIGGQPLVQPSGTVIVPSGSASIESIIAWRSTDGGTTWKAAVLVASVTAFTDPADIRSGPLPSASMDASGRVVVTWADCRFSTGCSANDIVYSSSSDGVGRIAVVHGIFRLTFFVLSN